MSGKRIERQKPANSKERDDSGEFVEVFEEYVERSVFDDLKRIMEKNHSTLMKRCEELQSRNEELFGILEKEKLTRISDVEKLQKRNEGLKKDSNSLQKSLDNLRTEYMSHIDHYHTIKYEINKFDTIPKSEHGLKVFVGNTNDFVLMFRMKKGGIMIDQQAIDFEELVIKIDDEKIDNEKLERNPVQVIFTTTFEKVGKSKVYVEFKDVKKEYFVEVFDLSVSESKSEIALSKERFKVGENLEFSLIFKNEGGMDLPFSAIEDLDIMWFVKKKGEKKKLRKKAIEQEEENFNHGELECEGFELTKKKFGGTGEYEIEVTSTSEDGGFSLKKMFVIE